MKPFTLNQRLEIHSIPIDGGLNGEIVRVIGLPGHYEDLPECYAVERTNGSIIPAIAKHLRPFPPVLPNGRGDLDKKGGWAAFQAATGIPQEQMDRILGLTQ